MTDLAEQARGEMARLALGAGWSGERTTVWMQYLAEVSRVDEDGREARRVFNHLRDALRVAGERAALGRRVDTYDQELHRFFEACPKAGDWLHRVTTDPGLLAWVGPSEWKPRRRLIFGLRLDGVPWRTAPKTSDYALALLALVPGSALRSDKTMAQARERLGPSIRLELKRVETERARYVEAAKPHK